MSQKETAKQRLVSVTRELICKGKKPDEITVAEITETAGVGNGMVNYHFQSKDNLIKTAVREVIFKAKEKFPEKLEKWKELPVKERMVFILTEVSDFLADNPEVSRIAILDNLAENDGQTHILSDLDVFNNCLYELLQGDTKKILINNFLIAGVFNFVFLKADIIKKQTGFDFYNSEHRSKAVSDFVNEMTTLANINCINKCKKEQREKF
ncbi:MAG: TetR family transcriptional regulator [Eubacterium sp.]|jgi:AcrR family transcriptional regulator|nr:TetR family transcriptional regulator [Eubacterium sp.]